MLLILLILLIPRMLLILLILCMMLMLFKLRVHLDTRTVTIQTLARVKLCEELDHASLNEACQKVRVDTFLLFGVSMCVVCVENK